MVEGKWFAPGTDIGPCEEIRQAVFGRGVDEMDKLSWNVIVWHDGMAAGTGRLWWQEGAFWLGDIAIPEEKRGKKLGDLVLRLICPKETAAFFARLGFKPESELDGGQLQMMLRGEDLCLDTCKGCKKNCPNAKPAE